MFKAEVECFDNDAEGHSAGVAQLLPLSVSLLVMAATGGDEAALARALQTAGLAKLLRSAGAWARGRASLIAELPALGRLNRREIAARVHRAPL